MSDWQLKLYHALPAPLRSVAASWRGRQIKAWRFGPETDQLVAEALERDNWSAAKWQAWRSERLAFVLHRAATQVPFYREWWSRRRQRGDRTSFEQLEHWPIVTKEQLRAKPEAFVAGDCDVRSMLHERTSGTSGKPLSLWWTRATVRGWSALVEARVRRWHGASRHDHWAILGGQPVVPGGATRPPFWVWNWPMRQLYLSANHVSPTNARHYIAALDQHGATHLWGYASSLAYLADQAARSGVRPRHLKVVFTNAEPLHPWQREAIVRGFGCEVRETYGMAEIVMGASECPHGSMHVWPEAGVTEVWSDDADEPVTPGTAGRLVCTSLLNADMPLVRYELGDRGRMRPSGWRCSCGRELPGLEAVQGRTNDMLLTADGRRVFWLNPVLYGLPLREAQIVQEAVGRIIVRYAPAEGFNLGVRETIRERLISRIGLTDVLFEEVTRVPREANGKFRAVRCLIVQPATTGSTPEP